MYRGFVTLIAIGLCLAATAVTADTPSLPAGADNKTPAKAPARPQFSVTPEREAAALTFVKQHHAELAELLLHLQENDPKSYERAVRDLFRTAERLGQIRDRDREQYDLELKVWQLKSRIELLTAQVTMSPEPKLVGQLKKALQDQATLRIELLRRERDKFAERVEKLDSQISGLEKDKAASVDRQLQSLIGPLAQPDASTEVSRRPADRKADDKKVDDKNNSKEDAKEKKSEPAKSATSDKSK